MIKAERQNMIKRLLENQGAASVKGIADSLGVSEMTIRRDLAELAERDELVRVHGGARTASPHRQSMRRREYSHVEKRGRNKEEKRAIALRAVSLIEPDSTIFLGTGTTVEQMVSLLPSCSLRIVTNSFAVFNMIESDERYELYLVGGRYRARTTAFVGPLAENVITSLGIDAAFIGANGIADGEVSTSNVDEGRFQQLAFNQADARYLLADASKVGRRDFYTFYRLENTDALISDAGLTDDQCAALEEYTTVLCPAAGR